MSINEGIKRKRAIARILGNFGISFFGPLASGSVAETLFKVGLLFEQVLIIAALAALFQTGYTISLEVRSLGENKNL